MSDRADDFRIGPSPSGQLLCGGCTPDDRCRLGVEIAHADEAATTVALHREARLVTKSLHISYHRPVPVERPLTVTARIDSHAGHRWEVSARMTLAGGTVALASASAELRTRRPDHFARHQAWLAHE
ncbi:hotdog domain-containing protein [Amycolatopsis sp. NPDC054798]